MSTLPPDPWKILGVDKAADKSEVRSAYKKLVLKCHPDKVQDPTLKAQKQEEFQKVQQAYELLNDDNERSKYEEQVKIMELRKQAAMMAKNMPNSSATRTPPRHMAFEIRTAGPGHKNSSVPSSGGKVYAHYASVHSRSHEDIPPRMYTFDDGEKHARRTASYEKTRRDDDRREKDERRRSRKDDTRRDDEEPRIRESRELPRDSREAREREIREKEREIREREARREARKKHERDQKTLDKERRKEQEDKRSRHKSPYIEDYDPEDFAAKTKEKRSSSKKPYEGREVREGRDREKSTSRRAISPHVETVEPPTEVKYASAAEAAASYIERSKRSAAPAPAFRAPAVEAFFVPSVPTPPPADPEEEASRHISIRNSAARRSSHNEGSKSREKLSSSHSSQRQFLETLGTSPGGRMVPTLSKSQSTPPIVPESPPRVNRANTTPLEFSQPIPHHPPPAFTRTQTWAAPGEAARHQAYFDHEDSDDDHDRSRRHRRSRRRSPERQERHYRYNVVDGKTSKVDDGYYYSESPNSTRYPDAFEPHSPSSPYPPQFKVRQSRTYGPADVKYSDVSYNVSHPDYYQVSA